MTNPALHFAVRNVTFTPTVTGYTVTCYTNNPAHLFLRWTTTTPQKHIHSKIVRGAPVGTYIDQCFVVYTDVEQNEPGDTWTHTFTLDPWGYCETRWFYFWGTVSGVTSPSASCILSFHSTALVKYCTSTPLGIGYSTSTGCNILCFPIKSCCTYTVHTFHTKLRRTPSWEPQNTIEIWIFAANSSGVPTSTMSYGYNQGFTLPPYPTWADIYITMPHFQMTQGVMYSIGVRLSVDFKLTTGRRLDQDGYTDPTCPPGLPPGDGIGYMSPGYWYPSMFCKPPNFVPWNPNPTGLNMYHDILGLPPP